MITITECLLIVAAIAIPVFGFYVLIEMIARCDLKRHKKQYMRHWLASHPDISPELRAALEPLTK